MTRYLIEIGPGKDEYLIQANYDAIAVAPPMETIRKYGADNTLRVWRDDKGDGTGSMIFHAHYIARPDRWDIVHLETDYTFRLVGDYRYLASPSDDDVDDYLALQASGWNHDYIVSLIKRRSGVDMDYMAHIDMGGCIVISRDTYRLGHMDMTQAQALSSLLDSTGQDWTDVDSSVPSDAEIADSVASIYRALAESGFDT